MSYTDKRIRGYERLACPNAHELYVPLDYDYMGVYCSRCGELATLVQATDGGTAEREQAIQQALTHVRTADEWRKRREMDQLKKELNLAKAVLSRALHTESDHE